MAPAAAGRGHLDAGGDRLPAWSTTTRSTECGDAPGPLVDRDRPPHAGAVLGREQILDRVWGYDYDDGSSVVEVYIRYLRRKLGAEVIETIRGSGYRFGR